MTQAPSALGTVLVREWPRVALVVAVLLLGLAPSLGWMLQAWGGSPLDTWGWVFLLLAIVWWLLILDLVDPPEGLAVEPAAWAAAIAALALFGAAWALDVRVLAAAAGLALAWSAAWLLLGGVLGLLSVPSLLLGVLSLPTVGFLLTRAWRLLGTGPASALALKAGLALAILLAGAGMLALARRGRLPRLAPAQASYLLAAGLAVAGLVLALHPPAFGPPLALVENGWAFGRWLGAEIPTSPSERELFSASRRLSKRLYASTEGGRVSVLIVETRDIHDLHAPEYCLSGSGWVFETGAAERQEAKTEPLPLPIDSAAELSAARGDLRLAGVYWYSSASRSTADFAGLRMAGRGSPGEPFTLYLISAVGEAGGSPRETLASFLREAPWRR
jgi:hypothetical protein